MSKFHFVINEISRATATLVLSAGVAAAYIAVMTDGDFDPSAHASTEVRTASLQSYVPERPAGARRWRSSNAEQSLATLSYYGEPNHWGRNRAALEGAMTLFQMGGTFSSNEIAGGTLTVTLSHDYLGNYLATPSLGGDEPISFVLESAVGQPFVVTQVLTRAFVAEHLAQK